MIDDTFISEFEPVLKEDISKDDLTFRTFRASHLANCYSQAYRILNKLGEYSDSSKRFFIEGTKVHYFRNKLNEPAFPLQKEDSYYIHHKKLNIYVKGQMDFIGLDEMGIFLLDYKSTSFESFYFKLTKGIPENYINQLSIYKYIYYIHTGVDIDDGVIRFIDRKNVRNYFQISIKLPNLFSCESFILNHPLILFSLRIMSKEEFKKKIEEYSHSNKYLCQKKYCGFTNCFMHESYQNNDETDPIFFRDDGKIKILEIDKDNPLW